VRFRSLGCYPLTGAQASNAASVPAIIEEMLRTTTSERQSRASDAESAAAMENRKREGYF
jgi:sulfate adenylyltransferase subunit 2